MLFPFSRPALSLACAAALQTLSLNATADTTLDPIVVSASRTPQSLSQTLSDINRVEIDSARSGQQALGDVLQTQRGVELNRNGGPQAATSIFIRGSNTNQSLVFLDGMRIGSATLGAATVNAIPLAQVDSIEILRGPASSLYGAGAIGGIIDIQTRKPTAPLEANASAGFGRWNTSKFNGGVAGKSGKLSYALQVAQEQSQGYSTITNPNNFSYNEDKDGYRLASQSGLLGYDWAEGHELAARFFNSKLNGQYDSAASYDDRDHQKLQASSVSSKDRINDSWTSRVLIGQTVDDATADSAYPGQFRTRQVQMGWQNDLTVAANQLLTLGVERLEEHVEASSYTSDAPGSRSTNSLLAVYQARFAPHSLQANLRYDDNSQYGDKTTGMLQYGLQFAPDWRATGSFGTAFRAPSFNELYFPGYGQTGIDPETARNGEIGVQYRVKQTEAGVTAYRNRVKNLIDYQSPCSTPGYPWGCAANVKNATLEGVTVHYNRQFGSLKLQASGDWQNPQDDSNGKQLARRAKRHGAIGISQQWQQFAAGATLLGSSKRYNDAANNEVLPGYGLLNLNASYDIDKRLQLAATLENSLDKQYELAKDYATPRRNLFVSLNYRY